LRCARFASRLLRDDATTGESIVIVAADATALVATLTDPDDDVDATDAID